MRHKIAGSALLACALLAGCGPSPGSAEWCKAVVEGSVQPTEADMIGNMDKCAAHEQAR